MPHFYVDYSPNLEDRMDIAGLCDRLCKAAADTGVFPVAGIRVRATPCAYFVIADGNADHAYLDLSVRLRGGRDLATRKAATESIFKAMETYCKEVMDTSSFMLSMEMRDIDPELSPKASSIRKYLPGEAE